MDSIIVTVRKEEEQQGHDLEIPLRILARDIVQELAIAFGWSSEYRIFVSPLSRLLAPDESLAQVGVWDGAELILTRQNHGSPHSILTTSSSPSDIPLGGPLVGWRSLDLGMPPSAQAAPPSPSLPGGFTWKQIDED